MGGRETPRTREKGTETAREGGGRPRAPRVREAGCERPYLHHVRGEARLRHLQPEGRFVLVGA